MEYGLPVENSMLESGVLTSSFISGDGVSLIFRSVLSLLGVSDSNTGVRLSSPSVLSDSGVMEIIVIFATSNAVSYTHLRAHETREDLVCRLLLEKKK